MKGTHCLPPDCIPWLVYQMNRVNHFSVFLQWCANFEFVASASATVTVYVQVVDLCALQEVSVSESSFPISCLMVLYSVRWLGPCSTDFGKWLTQLDHLSFPATILAPAPTRKRSIRPASVSRAALRRTRKQARQQWVQDQAVWIRIARVFYRSRRSRMKREGMPLEDRSSKRRKTTPWDLSGFFTSWNPFASPQGAMPDLKPRDTGLQFSRELATA